MATQKPVDMDLQFSQQDFSGFTLIRFNSFMLKRTLHS